MIKYIETTCRVVHEVEGGYSPLGCKRVDSCEYKRKPAVVQVWI